MKLALNIILLAFVLTGCRSNFAEIKESELNQAFILNSSPTFQGYYYLGSDESYHYFTGRWEYGRDKQFKIYKPDMVVFKEEPYGRTEIKIYQFKPKDFASELFCTIEHQDLFRKK